MACGSSPAGRTFLLHEVIDLPLIEKLLRGGLPPPMAEGFIRHMAQDHTVAEDVGRLAEEAGVRRWC